MTLYSLAHLAADPHDLSPGQACELQFAALRQIARHLERGQIGAAQNIVHDALEAVGPVIKEMAEAHDEFERLMGGPLPEVLRPVAPVSQNEGGE